VDTIAAFEAAGFEERAILDTVLFYGLEVRANIAGALFDTAMDAAFAWEPTAIAAE